MPNSGQTTEHIETALRSLDMLIKATRFYPPGHPAHQKAVEQALTRFAPLLLGAKSLVLTVRNGAFAVDGETLLPQNPILKSFATQLFARHVRSLLVLPDLSATDLRTAASFLALEPHEISGKGGIDLLLKQNRVSTVWTNEIDLASILTQKEEIENQRSDDEPDPRTAPDQAVAPPEQPPSPRESLAEILQNLERTASDQQFRSLLDELVGTIEHCLTEEYRPLILRALFILCRYAVDRTASRARQQGCQRALGRLTSASILAFLVEAVRSKTLPDAARQQLSSILTVYAGKIAKPLMLALGGESDAQARKFLATALIRLQKSALPTLIEHLDDPRWYVVRNAASILGEIRLEQAAEHMPPLLNHADVRVRREAVRALTKIGGTRAEGILLSLIEQNDREMSQQAILSLGALKSPRAIPTLIALINRRDLKGHLVDLKKEAIKALGEIGSFEAVPKLLHILRKRRFWLRSRHDELRASAALALGNIGDPATLSPLQSVAQRAPELVARAARQALNRLDKTARHAT